MALISIDYGSVSGGVEESFTGSVLDFESMWEIPSITTATINVIGAVSSYSANDVVATFKKKVKAGDIKISVTTSNINGMVLQYSEDGKTNWTTLSSTVISYPAGDKTITLSKDSYIRILQSYANSGTATFGMFSVGK